ncbi:unnamed protein product [Lactuca saligna]|uniref:Uncharacterized protein n=1 Tax=Lactuca saligna TaxID=75948 RepID=A0AA35XYU8_LACSI|nr:unnamed protein product [Lactuca saligna]
MVELQRRLEAAGGGEVWQSEGAKLNRRMGNSNRSLGDMFGNTSPDYFPFEFRALEVAFEAACRFLLAVIELVTTVELHEHFSGPLTEEDAIVDILGQHYQFVS